MSVPERTPVGRSEKRPVHGDAEPGKHARVADMMVGATSRPQQLKDTRGCGQWVATAARWREGSRADAEGSQAWGGRGPTFSGQTPGQTREQEPGCEWIAGLGRSGTCERGVGPEKRRRWE